MSFMALQSCKWYNTSVGAMLQTSSDAATTRIRSTGVNSIPHASGIYQILCIPTRKVYIGSAVDLPRRWAQHRWALIHGTHKNRHLQSAWNKYGAKAFTFSVLQACDPSSLVDLEQFWIDATACYDRQKGFNIRRVAESNVGIARTPEVRAKLSAAKIGKKYGPMPAATRAKLSAAHKGKSYWQHTPETRAKITKAQTGRRWSEAVKEKLRQAAKGRVPSEATRRAQIAAASKKWIVTDPHGAEYHITNLEAFCRERGLVAASMGQVASGKVQQHRGWKCHRLS